MKKFVAATLVGLLAVIVAAPAWATPFSVSPVRIYMTPKEKAVAVTITNEGEGELVMQADLYSWKQGPDGEDILTPTDELFLSPPIIKLAGKSRQVVRLARMRPMTQQEQQTFRLIVREIPEALANQESLQVQVALAFSLPVFVTPPKAKYHLECSAGRSNANTVRLNCENRGNAYAQLFNFVVSDSAGARVASRDAGAYILPGLTRTFELTSSDKPLPSGKLQFAVKLDDGSELQLDIPPIE